MPAFLPVLQLLSPAFFFYSLFCHLFGPEGACYVPSRFTPVVSRCSQKRQRPDGTRLHSERQPLPTQREIKTTKNLPNANTSEREASLCLERDLMRDVNTNTVAERVDGPHDNRTILLLQGRNARQTDALILQNCLMGSADGFDTFPLLLAR